MKNWYKTIQIWTTKIETSLKQIKIIIKVQIAFQYKIHLKLYLSRIYYKSRLCIRTICTNV